MNLRQRDLTEKASVTGACHVGAIATAAVSPTESTRAPTVACADAFEFMSRLGPCSVGAIFTDPPWATPTRDDVTRTGAVPLRADHVEWTVDIDWWRLVSQCARVLVDDGYALLWVGWHNVSLVISHANCAFGMGANNVIARVVPNPAPRVRGLRPGPDGVKVGGGLISSWDCIAVLHRAGSGSARCNLKGYQAHRNVRAAANPRVARGAVRHPAAKPEALCRELIEQFSAPGDVVLDPFCGGGSILAAAQATGRIPIGCDASPVWAAATRARLGLSA